MANLDKQEYEGRQRYANLRTEIDFRTEKMTMAAVMRKIGSMMAEHPERDYWLDGDTFSLLSALKVTA